MLTNTHGQTDATKGYGNRLNFFSYMMAYGLPVNEDECGADVSNITLAFILLPFCRPAYKNTGRREVLARTICKKMPLTQTKLQ